MSKQKDTGLRGADALFAVQNPPTSKTETADKPVSSKSQKKPSKPKTLVTSMRLKTATLAKLQALKIYILEHEEERMTYGDILDEAIAEFAKKKGLT